MTATGSFGDKQGREVRDALAGPDLQWSSWGCTQLALHELRVGAEGEDPDSHQTQLVSEGSDQGRAPGHVLQAGSLQRQHS